MIKDLEDTRDIYHGYSYVRTMRNILVGKEDAAIAPYFKDKPYYGSFPHLKLEDLENIMDTFVKANLIDVVLTKHGKLYCTHEYHNEICKKQNYHSYTHESIIKKEKALTYNLCKLINLDNNNIEEIDKESIIGYVSIGGNPYGVEGNVYILSPNGNEIKVYKGNVFKDLDEECLYSCIPETRNCYSINGSFSRCPKGWKIIYYLMGHYIYVPRKMAMKVTDNLKEFVSKGYKLEERMIRSICEAYISLGGKLDDLM